MCVLCLSLVFVSLVCVCACLQLEQLLQQERESLRRQRAVLGNKTSGGAADKMQAE